MFEAYASWIVKKYTYKEFKIKYFQKRATQDKVESKQNTKRQIRSHDKSIFHEGNYLYCNDACFAIQVIQAALCRYCMTRCPSVVYK